MVDMVDRDGEVAEGMHGEIKVKKVLGHRLIAGREHDEGEWMAMYATRRRRIT